MKSRGIKEVCLKIKKGILKRPSVLSLSLSIKEYVILYKNSEQKKDSSKKVTTRDALNAWALDKYLENKIMSKKERERQFKQVEEKIENKIDEGNYTVEEKEFIDRILTRKEFNSLYTKELEKRLRNKAIQEYESKTNDQKNKTKEDFISEFIEKYKNDEEYKKSINADKESFIKYVKKIALISKFGKNYREVKKPVVKLKTIFFLRNFLKEKNRQKRHEQYYKTVKRKIDDYFVYRFIKKQEDQNKKPKYKGYLFKGKDKEHEYLESGGRAICKKAFNKKTIKLVVAFGVVTIMLSSIMDKIELKNKISVMEPAEFKNEILMPDESVVKDEDGKIVEFPIVDSELIKVQKYLNKKMINDFNKYGIELEKIDEIVGIFEFDKSSASQGDKKILEVLVKSGDNIYSLQYLKEGSFTINSTRNDTGTLSSFNSSLSKSSLYGASIIDEEKQQILDKIESSIFVGDVYNYTTSSGTIDYCIPVYNETECKVFSISEQDITSVNDSLYGMLVGYLNEDNELFEVNETKTMDKKFISVLDAYDSANLLKDNQQIIEK